MGPTRLPKVLVIADVPSPHQNAFYDAIADLGEVELCVMFCRRLAPGRAWSGLGPRRAMHGFFPELPVRGIPLNPTLLPTLMHRKAWLPFVTGYYLPGMLEAGLFLGATGRRWAFWTDTLKAQKPEFSPSRLVGRFARRWFLKRSTTSLSTGQRGRDSLIAGGVQPSRAFEIPFVIDQQWIKTSVDAERPARTATRARLGVPDEATLLLFVGQMIERKGLDLLIHASAHLSAERARRLHVLMVGDGAKVPEWKALVLRLGLSDQFHFLPNTDNGELPPYWAAADAFVLPSRFDAWPVVVVEALTAGLPVLGSDACGSVVDRVRPGVNGWVFAAEDLASLQVRLEEVLALDMLRLAEMGQAARKSMDAYASHAMAQRFTDVVAATLSLPIH